MNNESASFTKKQIEISITLRAGDYGGKGNTKKIFGLPTKVKVEKTGPPDFCKAEVEIMGMKEDDVEKLSTLSFKPLTTAKNIIEIKAGNEKDGLSLVFKGEITNANADYNASPDIWMKFECAAGFYGEVTAQGPSAIKGSQDVASFIEQQAKRMGYAFRNDGVTLSVNNAIFNGSPMEQARAAARQVGAEMWVDDGTLILCPSGGGKQDKGNAVKLTKDTGLIKYPKLTNEGLELEALYNPAFQLGGLIVVESRVPKASGTWRIIKLSHELHAFCPSGGPWESHITAFPPNEDPKKTKESADKSKSKKK